MTPGRHAGRKTVPLWAVVFALAALAGGGFALADRVADDPAPPGLRASGAGPSSPSAGVSSPVQASASPSAAAKGSLLIHGAGDVSLDPSYISSYASQGYGYAWSGMGGLFRRDDLTIVNLECAVSDLGTAVPKEFNFRGDPAALPVMRDAGVEVANLGNNHSYDFGPDALLDTVRNVNRAGLAPVGAGATQEDALAPALFELRGWRVAVLGFDQVVDPFPEAVATDSKPGTAAGHDTGLMIDSVRGAADRADIVVVMIHWGVELDTQPRADQVGLGHRMIEAGADVIFGGHSHRLQPMETYHDRPIFYSLGNFVWPNFSEAGSKTAVAEVTVTPQGRFRGRLLPATITAPGHPVLR
ncbi:MAG: CapA family protein [Actinomycetota bacterium]|nr:CapA family protein [Actinomycetota bacterium]